MKKRKVVIIVLIIGVLLSLVLYFYPKHQVRNIFDEITLTGRSYLSEPYTKTTYLGMDATFTDRDSIRYMDARTRFRMENEDGIITACLIQTDRIEISITGFEIDNALIQLEYIYFVRNKHLIPVLKVHEKRRSEDENNIRYTEKEEMEAFLRKNGTSIEEIIKTLNVGAEQLLNEWLRANEGKTSFSEYDYGYYVHEELHFEEVW